MNKMFKHFPRDSRSTRRKGRAKDGRVLIVVAFAVFAALAMIFGVWYAYGTDDTRVCTVTDKDRVLNSEGNSQMRVYTEECGVFEVSDTVFRGVFNSADIFNEIQPGSTYEIYHYGWRIPVLSQFPTILEVREM